MSSPLCARRSQTSFCSTFGCPSSTVSPAWGGSASTIPTIAVVILSSYSDQAQIDAARKAGALGYIVKTVEPVDLAVVLRNALTSRSFEVWGAEVPVTTIAGTTVLSERETVVLEAVARGHSNREIGRQLWISEQTVKFHLRNVYRKLGVSSRTEAARFAYRAGIVGALTVESA